MVMNGVGRDQLQLVDLPDPVPGRREVLVRMRAASLNFRDILTVDGKYGRMQKTKGLVPLSDGAGEIVQVGSDASRFRVGQRVVGCFFPDWRRGSPNEPEMYRALGGLIDGVAAELRVFGENEILPIPDGMAFNEAACTPCAAVTAWHAVRGVGAAGPEKIVLTQGTGGVSLFALQFALAAGARVVATSSSDEKLELLRKLGASETINYRVEAEWARAARKLVGRGLDLVVDIGGTTTFDQSVRACAPGATIAVIGVIGGVTHQVNFPIIAMNSLRLQGIAVGNQEHHADLLNVMQHHQIKPVIDRTFALEELPEALAYLELGKHTGKVCISI